jgi:membrane-associated phospholipid phosphatase
MRSIWYQAYSAVQRPKRFIIACLAGIVFFLPYPTNLNAYRMCPPETDLPVVGLTEKYLRYTGTVVQIALPILLRDKIGMVQLLYTGISATIATHGLKRLVDPVEVQHTRLGERPSKPNSHQNMPSGHSSMASCAAYFVCRRYGFIHALYLLPILLLTMYARVALHDHTVSAVIVGALVGFLAAAVFTSRRRKQAAATAAADSAMEGAS